MTVDPKAVPFDQKGKPERTVYSFAQLSETGMLWLLNRVIFHPRGFALAIEYADGVAQPCGWSLIGNGTEVWKFADDAMEDEKFAATEALFAHVREHGIAPDPTP